ncbi:MAG TPA: bifunctional acetate--CoA ligase family protein/GNAT family N-acetyltransferase [Woeseiaceae bacterium]
MSIRNLSALFEPTSIALIGASNRPGSVGHVLSRNLFEGGFAGPIMTVNPKERAIRSTLSYRSVGELPVVPDLAVISTPPAAVPGLVGELGKRGCRAAIVITAGFGEGERVAGLELMQALLDAAEPHLLRIVGPNCLGVMAPHAGINASFAHIAPQQGDIALVTQSGAVATSVLDWAAARGIGFSKIVSLGSMSDVDFGDLLDYLALDPATRSILLYMEAVTHARKFLSAARMAARTKPVFVVKAGRSRAGAQAALSHTGALAGSDAVYETVFRRAGMLRVHTLDELFHAAGTLATGTRLQGDRLTILTNGGGIGVLAVDQLSQQRGQLAALSEAAVAALDGVLPAPWSRSNPVDILGDADGARYARALEVLFAEKESDAMLVLNCPTAVGDSVEAARAVAAAASTRGRAPVLACWLSRGKALETTRLLAANRIPVYDTPEQAVRAFGHLHRYHRNQQLLMETPPDVSGLTAFDRGRAQAVIDRALAEARHVLTGPEAAEVLAAYGIPTVPSMEAADADAACEAAERLGFPVVLKILSRDISHKSDVGGVQLNIGSAKALRRAAADMAAAVRRGVPGARIDGFIVQPMIRRPHAHELIAGVAEDAVFGPVILFGQGGTAAEVIGDRAVGLPPLNMLLAEDMIRETRIARLLEGYRDRPAAAREAIALVLVRLSELVISLERVLELDINPLLADPSGVLALDARIVLAESGRERRPLAIRPYPAQLENTIETRSGRRFAVRPIRPEDETALIDMLRRSTREDIRLRFFGAIKEFTHAFAARLTQIDYDREMAFVALPEDAAEILGVVRLAADPDREAAEFAIMVRSDTKGSGLGYGLMREIIEYARRTGIRLVFGEVLKENERMLAIAAELGFTVRPVPAPSDSVRVELTIA